MNRWTHRLVAIAVLPLSGACAAQPEPQAPSAAAPPVVVSVSGSPGGSGELRPEGADAYRADGEVTDEEVTAARKRERDRQIAEHAGILGLLQAADGVDSALGASSLDAGPDSIGSLLSGEPVGEASGAGGLGLSGVGRGGGGSGEAIGVGGIGRGRGSGTGYGRGVGRLGSSRRGRPPAVTSGRAEVAGKLDKEIIRRIIRRHLSQVRYCYQRELAKNPKLQGRLEIEFVIGQNGRVTTVSVQGPLQSDLDGCVAQAVRRMIFPKPKGGIVVVRYPFVFHPGSSGSAGSDAPRPVPNRGTRPAKPRGAPAPSGK